MKNILLYLPILTNGLVIIAAIAMIIVGISLLIPKWCLKYSTTRKAVFNKYIDFFIRVFVLIIACSLYYRCLHIHAIGSTDFGTDTNKYSILSGMVMLMTGMLGLIRFNFSWFANITFIITLPIFMFRRYHAAFYFSAATLLLGLSTLTLFLVGVGDIFYKIHLYAGYFYWMGSFLTLFIMSLLLSPVSPTLNDVKRVLSTLIRLHI